MKNISLGFSVILGTLLLLVSACSKTERTVAGLALGAGTGALIGGAAGGTGGAVAGGVLGGALGGILGNASK